MTEGVPTPTKSKVDSEVMPTSELAALVADSCELSKSALPPAGLPMLEPIGRLLSPAAPPYIRIS